jgi:long-chain fatty acid transport protein
MKNWKDIVILAVWAGFLAFGSLRAGGFQVNLQSVSQAAMGHTGAGLAFDASVAYFNPGGLAFAPTSVSAGFTPIFPRISYAAPSPDNYTANNVNTISTPFSLYGALKHRFNDDHAIAGGIAIYTPFGSRVVYPDDWKGQFALREISLKTIFIQPTIGYNYKDKFGIGGGFVYATGDVLLRRALPVQFTNGSYGEATLSAGGKGMGFNIGTMLRPIPALTLGQLPLGCEIQCARRPSQICGADGIGELFSYHGIFRSHCLARHRDHRQLLQAQRQAYCGLGCELCFLEHLR